METLCSPEELDVHEVLLGHLDMLTPTSTTTDLGLVPDSHKLKGSINWAQSDDWERVKLTIARLYKVERKKLREVKEIMERHHNFHATLNMYKKRVTKWGLDKNLKRDEVVAMAAASTQRLKHDSKPSEFVIRGETVDERRISRYLRRNEVARRQLKQQVHQTHPSPRDTTHSPIPSTAPLLTTPQIRARTPSPSPSPNTHFLQTTALEAQTETLLSLSASYIAGAFSSNIWSINALSLCQSRTEKPGQLLLGTIFSRFAIARLYAKHRPLEPLPLYALLEPVFPALETAVVTQTPFLLAFLMLNVWKLQQEQGARDIAKVVCEFVTRTAERRFGQSHGLVRAWAVVERLCKIDGSGEACKLLTRLFDDRLPDPRKPYLKYQGDRHLIGGHAWEGWDCKLREVGAVTLLKVEPDLFYSFPGFTGYIESKLNVKRVQRQPADPGDYRNTRISLEFVPEDIVSIYRYPLSHPMREYLFQTAFIGFENGLSSEDHATAQELRESRRSSLEEFLSRDTAVQSETEYGADPCQS